MARLKGPLCSFSASKQLAKTLIFKMKNDKAFVTRYNKPGGQNPFTRSITQKANRDLYGEAVEVWRNKTAAEKAYWNNSAEAKRLRISGWNLFYKYAFSDPEGYLGNATYGIRVYGYFKYGKVALE